jgi:hypothetical protein
MSLEDIVPRPELEQYDFHRLSEEQLRLKDDAEALFQRGVRLWYALGIPEDEDGAWQLIIEAAKLGHPVALAFCFSEGKGTDKNEQRAMELFGGGASRGHAVGIAFSLGIRVILAAHKNTTSANGPCLLQSIRIHHSCEQTRGYSVASSCCRSALRARSVLACRLHSIRRWHHAGRVRSYTNVS